MAAISCTLLVDDDYTTNYLTKPLTRDNINQVLREHFGQPVAEKQGPLPQGGNS